MPPRVVLVGPMGAGKTTVAGLLGDAWGVPVRDTDADIEATTGRAISDIFVESGEDALPRARGAPRSPRRSPSTTACWPSAAAPCSTRRPATLLADVHRWSSCASGSPTRSSGSASASAARCCSATSASRIKALLDERTPVYESVATHVVDTDGRTPDEVAAAEHPGAARA